MSSFDATPFEFRTTPRIVCAPGSALRLAAIVREDAPMTRAFVVTDPGLVMAGVVSPVVDALEADGVEVVLFDAVEADPPERVVFAAVDAARAAKADVVVGLGGGSSMDTAKLVAVLLGTDQPLSEMYGLGKVRDRRTVPLVLVPTTAGTGSEVTAISIVTTGETTKMGVVAPQLYCDTAVLDADLTLGLPPHVTAATGIDAMVHAIESYTSKNKRNPVSAALAREALRLLSGNLVRACRDGRDRDARSAMLLGALLAGQAFANAPVAAVHALAYPLGGIFHVPHGLSNSLVLPHVLRFNAPVAEREYAELAEIVAPGAKGSAAARTEAFIAALDELADAVKIERRLREVGVSHNELPRLAEDAMKQTRLLVNNPREVGYDAALKIYEAAW